MNAEKIRGLDAAEIKKQLSEGDETMFRLRFQLSMGQMEGIKKLRELAALYPQRARFFCGASPSRRDAKREERQQWRRM